MINQNDTFWPLSLLLRFSTFSPPKTGGRLKIVLPNFPARVARGKPYLSVIWLWLFGQVHSTAVHWDLSSLITPAKTSVEGWAVPFCFWCISGRVHYYALGHYIACVQILDPHVTCQMALRDFAVCSDSRSDSICPSPRANPRLCNGKNTPHSNIEASMFYCWCDTILSPNLCHT